MSDWWFLGGLALAGLGTTQVLLSSQYSGQLLHTNIETLACLLCRAFIEILFGHF